MRSTIEVTCIKYLSVKRFQEGVLIPFQGCACYVKIINKMFTISYRFVVCEETHSCEECDTSFKSKEELEQHNKEEHAD
jgi:hypothetical protein